MKDALLIIVFVIFMGTGAIAAHEYDALADSEDAAAIASRKWVAGQYACPKGQTAIWLDDKTIQCLRERTAGARP